MVADIPTIQEVHDKIEVLFVLERVVHVDEEGVV